MLLKFALFQVLLLLNAKWTKDKITLLRSLKHNRTNNSQNAYF